MNWYSVFYWLTVADGVKNFFDVVSNIFTFFSFVFFVLMIVAIIGKSVNSDEHQNQNDEEDEKDASVRNWEKIKKFSQKLFFPFLIIAFISWIGYVLIPTKKDCLLIVAGGAVGNLIASDSSVRQLPGDITKFLHLSLQKEIADLDVAERKAIGVQTIKEKFLNKAVNMTKEELIEYIRSDSTLIKN